MYLIVAIGKRVLNFHIKMSRLSDFVSICWAEILGMLQHLDAYWVVSSIKICCEQLTSPLSSPLNDVAVKKWKGKD